MIRRIALIAAAAAALAVAAAVFLVAVYHWLRRDLLPEEALTIVAAILLLIGLVLLVVARQPGKAGPVNPATDETTVFKQMLARFVADNPLSAAASAATLGFLLESRPDLVRTITNLLGRK